MPHNTPALIFFGATIPTSMAAVPDYIRNKLFSLPYKMPRLLILRRVWSTRSRLAADHIYLVAFTTPILSVSMLIPTNPLLAVPWWMGSFINLQQFLFKRVIQCLCNILNQSARIKECLRISCWSEIVSIYYDCPIRNIFSVRVSLSRIFSSCLCRFFYNFVNYIAYSPNNINLIWSLATDWLMAAENAVTSQAQG